MRWGRAALWEGEINSGALRRTSRRDGREAMEAGGAGLGKAACVCTQTAKGSDVGRK